MLALAAAAPRVLAWDPAWTNGNQFAGYVIGNEASSSVVERAVAASISPTASTGDWWWGSFFKQRSKCKNAKDLLKQAIESGNYLDLTRADASGIWEGYLLTNSLISAEWTVSNLLAHVGVSNDYFEVTPWFGGALLNGPYGFQALRAIVTNLVARRVDLSGFLASATNVSAGYYSDSTWAGAVGQVQSAWVATNVTAGRHPGVVFDGYENAGDGTSWDASAGRSGSGYVTETVNTNFLRQEQFYFRAGPYFLSSTYEAAWVFDNAGDSRIQTNFTLYSCSTSSVSALGLRVSTGDLAACPDPCEEPEYLESSSRGWQPYNAHAPSTFGSPTNYAWVVFRYDVPGGFVYK